MFSRRYIAHPGRLAPLHVRSLPSTSSLLRPSGDGVRAVRRGLSSSVAAAASCSTTATAALCMQQRFQSASAPAAPNTAAPSAAATGHDAFAHITRNLVWELWNEGNLFSLSAPELAFYLKVHGAGSSAATVQNLDTMKKSALVRLVEELLSAEQQATSAFDLAQQQNRDVGEVPHPSDPSFLAGAAAVPTATGGLTVTEYDRIEEALDEADEYGDWGVEPGFEAAHAGGSHRRAVEYMAVNPTRLSATFDPMCPRAYQLLHSHITADVQVRQLANVHQLPGQSQNKEPCFTVCKVAPYEANKARFRRAMEWCLLNSWNVNLPAELNMGAGKILFYQYLAKQNKRVLPLWTLQHHVAGQHPYAFFAVANERNERESIEGNLVQKLAMDVMQGETTTYRLNVRRMGESFDLVLNDNLQCVSVNRPWDRFFVSHYVRQKMPDIRFLVRARHPIKKKVSDLYLESDILRRTRDSVQSVLIPELGDVTYCCERQMRRWCTRTPKTSTQIQLVETRRTPLIISRLGDEGQRLEYEFIVQLPTKAERVDVAAFCDEMWDFGNMLAQSLEEGMEDFMAHTMSTSASF